MDGHTAYIWIFKMSGKVPYKKLVSIKAEQHWLKETLKEWMKGSLEDKEMKTVVKDINSEWRKIACGVPQGSVWAINIHKWQARGKQLHQSIYRWYEISKVNINCQRLRSDREQYKHDIQVKYNTEGGNAKKYHVLEMGSEKQPTRSYKMAREILIRKKEKHLRLVIQDNMSPEKHLCNILLDTYRMLMNTKIYFSIWKKKLLKK